MKNRKIKRAVRYVSAVGRWVQAGRPVRSDQRVQEIFDALCRPCPHFSAERKTCKLCACRIRRSGAAFLNKLKMATEQCPAHPPKWTKEIPEKGP